DYVIRALNDDMPYDRFLCEQLAADLLTEEDKADKRLAALGFLTLGGRFINNVHDIIDDRLDVIFRGTQALTVGCARCHDHKFDPIPTRDYYSLYGVLANTTEETVRLRAAVPPKSAGLEEYEKELDKRQKALRDAAEKHRAEASERFRARTGEYLIAVL